jgi:hypothetical protein
MVAVLSKDKKPLMPCSEKRARKLLESNRAKPYWFKGIFTIIMQECTKEYKQDIAIGIDPGSKFSGISVKTETKTLINIQYNAPTYVKDKVEGKKLARMTRRQRKTPYRKCRFNRSIKNRIPPSTKSRWQQHLNLVRMLSKIYPITLVSVEDIQAVTKKGAKKWNRNFSPLEVGKNWFYSEIEKDYRLFKYSGFETYQFRQDYGFKKNKDKAKVCWHTHCVDGWVLANQVLSGDLPDNKRVLNLKPLNFFRRQLHAFCPIKGNIRRPYGGTLSLGIKRGTLVKHPKYGRCLTGGTTNGRISLSDLKTNKRLCQNARIEDLTILTQLKFNYN